MRVKRTDRWLTHYIFLAPSYGTVFIISSYSMPVGRISLPLRCTLAVTLTLHSNCGLFEAGAVASSCPPCSIHAATRRFIGKDQIKRRGCLYVVPSSEKGVILLSANVVVCMLRSHQDLRRIVGNMACYYRRFREKSGDCHYYCTSFTLDDFGQKQMLYGAYHDSHSIAELVKGVGLQSPPWVDQAASPHQLAIVLPD